MRTTLSVISAAVILASMALPAMAGPAAIAVPEPASLALLAGGVAALAVVKFGRRR